MSSIGLFLVATGGVSAIIYWMSTRLGDPLRHRRSAYNGSSTDGGGTGSAWSLSSWFGGDTSSHESTSSTDFSSGGGDSGGGGDSDGGGGGD